MFKILLKLIFLSIAATSQTAVADTEDLKLQPKIYLSLVTPALWSTGVFGHGFVTIQNPHEPLMLSQSFNYNKFLDPNNRVQAVQNATGLLPLEMEVVPFFYLYKHYANEENRSLILYELDLNGEETQKLILRLNSDKNKEFSYSLNSNCITRIVDHINAVVAENKKIFFKSSLENYQLGTIWLQPHKNALLAHFPMYLMRQLNHHPLIKSKQFLDSRSVKIARTFIQLENNFSAYAQNCGWQNYTLNLIIKNYWLAAQFPDQIDRYLIPYAKLAKNCGLPLSTIKRDFVSFLEAIPTQNNQLISAFFKQVEDLYEL